MINKLLCSADSTIIEVMRTINANSKGCAFIVDDYKRLCGVLTDGDIRRMLLDGATLNDRIKSHLDKRFVFAYEDESNAKILEKIDRRIKIIPIVNERMQVTDFFECKADISIPIARPDLTGNEMKYLTEAFLSTWISSSGHYINSFENAFADYCKTSHSAACSNGTAALHLALMALGVGPGDEVIVPDLTFAATINCVLHTGATPVIVDVEPVSWCIDPDEVEKAITSRTRAIIPVHLFGQPADMSRIMDIADRHSLFVVEDCAEAHGAEFAGRKVGSIGHVGCFSFFANKVITCGEGGMCVTDDPQLAQKIRILRDHGMNPQKRYWHDVIGYNYRMTNLQAAIGLAQLERIGDILNQKNQVEQAYRDRLANLPWLSFQADDLPGRSKITWLVSCLTDGHRDEIIAQLKTAGIDCRPFFYSLGDMPIYADYVFSNKVSREISQRGIMFPTNDHCDGRMLGTIHDVISEIFATADHRQSERNVCAVS